MPDSATVHAPGFAYAPGGDTSEQMECDDLAIKCLFTLQAAPTVHAECAAPAFTAVRCAAIKAAFEDHQAGS
eukprot:3080582-Pyramimonas_sp.AAC.1